MCRRSVCVNFLEQVEKWETLPKGIHALMIAEVICTTRMTELPQQHNLFPSYISVDTMLQLQ